MKKFWVIVLCTLCVGTAVFFTGWLQFAVDAGQCAVLLSKSSGVYPHVIENGGFDWRWERLLPTNTKLYHFTALPYASNDTISGTLPSAATYSAFLEKTPDFSYSFTVLSSITVKPNSLPRLVQNQGIATQDALDAYLKQKSASLAAAASQAALSHPRENSLQLPYTAIENDAIRAVLQADPAFSDITIHSLTLASAKVPDAVLYNEARALYTEYRNEMSEALLELSSAQAETVIKNNAAITRLERLGALFVQYPALLELFKTSGLSDSLRALDGN